MVRRTPKPFTVEVRRSGRKSPPAAAAVANDPAVTSAPDDQPHVSWPGLDGPQAAATAAAPQVDAAPAAASRILPALDEARPSEPEPLLRPRRLAETKPAAAEAVPPEADTSGPLELAADRLGHEPDALAVDADPEPVDVTLNARSMAATILLRQGKKRLSRDEFSRGERWKARLPAAALGSVKRARRPRPAS